MSAAREFWRSGRGLQSITPQGKELPEGEHFPHALTHDVGDGVVLEFGCGTGRLAKYFDPSNYVGVDICQAAIDIARDTLPDYSFYLIDDGEELPESDVTICHTVLLHISDDEIDDVVNAFSSGRVIVCEVMDSSWRRTGDPPVFNRDPSDYVSIFAKAGYEKTLQREIVYDHYIGRAALTLLGFSK